mgnify:CR=1 FL=1
MDIGTAEWIRCPVYGGMTRTKQKAGAGREKDRYVLNCPQK